MGFSRQEYWSGLPFPSPGDLPDPEIKPRSPALAGGFFPAEPPGRLNCSICIFWYQIHFTFPQYLTKQNNHLLLSTFSNNSQPTLTSLYSTQVASKCFATFLESFVLYSIQIIDCLLISLVHVSYIYS